MKVRVPMMVDDGRFAPLGRGSLVEGFDIEGEEAFFDGPATPRLIVVDRDEHTGKVLPGLRFIPPPKGRVLGRYEGAEGRAAHQVDVRSRAFNLLSVFATALKTIYMFEEPDTLGRRIRWAFDNPQLTIVPRAGIGENAYYSRQAESVLFYSFPNRRNRREMIHTSLARDIVAHEIGHAVLDGIAPDLWTAKVPQAYALHEAVSDLTALLVSLRSRTLISDVLKRTGGSIEHSTHFSALAEEFGYATEANGAAGGGALRDLKNDLTMAEVDPREPYQLSQVLTGALYSVLVRMHDVRKREAAEWRGDSTYSVSGYALYGAAQHFKRMVLRALDYLPPGDITFADYGRAILAADAASHPDDSREREWMIDEFVRRGIVQQAGDLDVAIPSVAQELLDRANLEALVAGDGEAYALAGSEQGRAVFGIPPGAEFRVLPRLSVEKVYYHRGADRVLTRQTVSECLFKVQWTTGEEAEGAPRTAGAALAWDCNARKVRALLTAGREPQEGATPPPGGEPRRLSAPGATSPAQRLPSRGRTCMMDAPLPPL